MLRGSLHPDRIVPIRVEGTGSGCGERRIGRPGRNSVRTRFFRRISRWVDQLIIDQNMFPAGGCIPSFGLYGSAGRRSIVQGP